MALVIEASRSCVPILPLWTALAQETPNPMVDLAIWIEVLALDRAGQVRDVLRAVGEGIAAGMVLKLKVEGVDRRVIKADPAIEAEFLGSTREPRDGDAVPEHVVHPMQGRRFGHDGDRGFDQPLIVAVARPERDPMLAERNRLAITVGRDMADGEDRHGAA